MLKNQKFYLVTLTSILLYVSHHVRDPISDFTEEKEIMSVIERESKSFWDKDFKNFSDCWAHQDYVRIIGWWSDGGISVTEGWNTIGKKIQKMMLDNPVPNPQNPVRKNINIRIGKDMAWVTFDQYGKDTDDPKFDMPGLSRETRVLEKIEGKWKIVYVGWLLQGQ
ncbi:MAG: nuclear transport factor 2 family protein [Saprospiraceae bacterium]|nr:nuclear transport factor 2 family protein [Saprospiraceae bacterium]